MSSGQQGAGEPSARRLFAVYAAVSLVPVLILGVALSVLVNRMATSSGLREGASEAQLVARSAIAPLLDGHDLSQGLRVDESSRLDERAGLITHNQQVLRLRVRDLAGRVVWAP